MFHTHEGHIKDRLPHVIIKYDIIMERLLKKNKTQGFRVELQVSGGRGTRLGTRQGQDRDKTETSQRQVRGKTKKRKGQDKGGGG